MPVQERKKKKWLPDVPGEEGDDIVVDRAVQERILGDFEHANASLLKLWQGVFCAMSFIIGAVFLWGGYTAISDRFTSTAVRFFGRVAQPSTLFLFHVISALPFLLLGTLFVLAIRRVCGQPKANAAAFVTHPLFQTSVVLAITSGIVWAKLISLAKLWDRYVLFYLPVGPLLYCFTAMYVDSSLRDLGKDVEDLKKLMYDAKTL